jgi:hypothetical protein
VPRRRRLALILSLAIVLAPGCRSTAELVYGGYTCTSSAFTPNPVAMPAYFVGLVVGFIAGLPLCLLSWPASLLGYPREDGDEFFITSSLAPSVSLGSLVGTILAAPFYPFGYPFVPDEENAPPGPADRGPR